MTPLFFLFDISPLTCFLVVAFWVIVFLVAGIKDAGKKAFEISPNADGKLLESLLVRPQPPTRSIPPPRTPDRCPIAHPTPNTGHLYIPLALAA